MGSGSTAVITGASRGLGRASAAQLAALGFDVVLAGRPSDAMTHALETIAGSRHVELDLSSLASVRHAVEQIRRLAPIELLVANAGRAGPGGVTGGGIERTMAVNHLGHFALATGLREVLTGGRLVVVTSNAHFDARGLDIANWHRPARGTGFEAYRQSKLAGVLFVREAARRWPDVNTVAVHPGMVATDIWRRVPQPVRWWITRSLDAPEVAARWIVEAATDGGPSGTYFDRGNPRDPSALALDDDLAVRVWDASLAAIT